MATSKEEQARILAATLKEELGFPVEPSSGLAKKWKEQLYDEPPTRTELKFQTTSSDQRRGIPVVKEASKMMISASDDPGGTKTHFCSVHKEFVRESGTDVEHGTSLRKIRTRQQQFIEFLNSDNEFANYFLALQDLNVGDYFKRDPKDNKIKGTAYFYKVCYNDKHNLWLLCHSCNIEKSDNDSLEWFKNKKTFGDNFVDAVNAAGGLHRGIILDVVGGEKACGLDVEGTSIDIYKRGKGIGEYACKWFEENHQLEFNIQKEFRTTSVLWLFGELENIQELERNGKQKDAQKSLKELQGKLKAFYVLQQAELKEVSSSDSDTPSQEERKSTQPAKTYVEVNLTNHDLKNFESAIISRFGKGIREEVHKFFSDIHVKVNEHHIPPQDVKEIRERFEGELDKEVSWAALSVKIKESFLSAPQKQAIAEAKVMREKKAREAADARAEAEARAKQEEARGRQEEARARQEAEARAEVEARGRQEEARARQEAERLVKEQSTVISELLAAQTKHKKQREQVAIGANASGGALLLSGELREEEKRALKRARERSLESSNSEENSRNDNVDVGGMPSDASSTKKRR